MNRLRILTAALIVGVFAAPAASQEAKFTSDIVYGHKAGMALIYQMLQPEEPNGATVVYMLSGGWFSWHMPEQASRQWFGYLANAGYTVIAVNHGSAPRFKVPEALADVRRAIRHIRAHSDDYGIDPNRLAVMGASAGGHLSLMLGLASDEGDATAEDEILRVSNRVHAVVAYFPPVDLSESVGPNDSFPALDFDPELAPDVSPINFVSEDDPPTLLIHGDQDRLVPISNSERMHAALNEVGVSNKLVVMEGVGHDMGDPANMMKMQREILDFLAGALAEEE